MQIKYENANTCVFLKKLKWEVKNWKATGHSAAVLLYSYHPADVSVTQYSIL